MTATNDTSRPFYVLVSTGKGWSFYSGADTQEQATRLIQAAHDRREAQAKREGIPFDHANVTYRIVTAVDLGVPNIKQHDDHATQRVMVAIEEWARSQ